MPSSFIRKHVRSLMRNKFAPSTSGEEQPENNEESDPPTPNGEENDFITHCYLAGVDSRKFEFPQVYCGKTGLDIPCIQLELMDLDVFASFTGPDGGLTQVGEVRGQQIAKMANIDDEMSLSTDGFSDEEIDEENNSPSFSRNIRHSQTIGSCSSILEQLGELPDRQEPSPGRSSADDYDWEAHDAKSAFGISVSLYEKNPITGVNAGDPVADVWGVVGRTNNGVLALADGVNWGEGSRLAARCAIRGAIDHLNNQIHSEALVDTTVVFHELLAAFHSAHSLILQEGGTLTTLCVAVVAPAKVGNSWVLCCCNVGDSLCFVYNRSYGVREVTLGSHDIDQMRDMRDAGGALGPVDGRNPQLHNLTCSMTFVEPGDVVFITSDGVSDNFDPVVGKFCVIKKSESENKENSHLPPREDRTLNVSTKDSPTNGEYGRNRTCAASMPCVDAARRHELMLVRMRDVIANGLQPQSARTPTSPRHVQYPAVSASLLCHRLIQFATQLSQAKRRVLENPELYKKEKMTKSEQRARRKAVREKIGDMPGKLDHASVVAYHVSRIHERDLATPLRCSERVEQDVEPRTNEVEVTVEKTFDNFHRQAAAECATTIVANDTASASITIKMTAEPVKMEPLLLSEIVDSNKKSPRVQDIDRPKSPYEQIPVTSVRDVKRKKHARGTAGRHTLGVDVQWLKKLVTSRKDSADLDEIKEDHSVSSANPEKATIRQRIRSILGSTKGLSARDDKTTNFKE